MSEEKIRSMVSPIFYLYQEKDTGLWGICLRQWDSPFDETHEDKEECIKAFRKVHPDLHLYTDYESANKEYHAWKPKFFRAFEKFAMNELKKERNAKQNQRA